MTSTLTDRVYGESSGVAVKAPCLWVSTAPNPLNGLTGVVGGTPQPNDRVLVMGNTDPTTNGVYNASTGAWARSGDFDGSYDCVQGTLIIVNYLAGQALFFQLTTPNPIIGTTPLVFQPLNNFFNYFPVTTAEGLAGVTPINLQYPEGYVPRYGTNTTPGTTDMTVAINAALQVSAYGGAPAYAPAGVWAASSDLLMPMGVQYLQGGAGPFAASLKGAGKEQTEIRFIAGGSLTNGVYFNGGASYKFGGTLSDLMINGNGVAPQCLTLSFADITTIRNVIVRSSTGRGIFVDNSLMTRFEQVFVGGCGSANFAQVEVDGSLSGSTGGTTTTVFEQIYISGSNAGCKGGLMVDRSNNTMLVGGAIESTGAFGLAVSSKTTNIGCTGFSLIGTDFENLTDHFIELGYGLTGGAYVSAFTAMNLNGQPSGATTVPYAVKMSFVNGPRFINCAWGQGAAPTASYWLEGTNPLRVTIDEHASSAGAAYPWVMSNGAWLKAAGPLVQFNSHFSPTAPLPSQKAVTGTTWSALVSTAQGGWYEQLGAANVSGTNVTTVTDVPVGGRVYIKGDGQSVLKQGTGANQFNNKSAADISPAVNGEIYVYMNNGVYLDQL